MLTRILGIAIALFFLFLFVATAPAQEPCGRDGCPVSVKPVVDRGQPMPVANGPTVVYAAPVRTFAANHSRLMHPMHSFAMHHPMLAHPVRSFACHHPKLMHPMAMVRCRRR